MLQTGGIEQGGQQAWPVPPVWRDRRREGRVPDDSPLPGRPGSGALSRHLAGWGRPLPQGGYTPQSRQSARLFLQSSELGLPQPLTRRQVCPPHPLVPGGGGTLAGGRGGGRVPIPTRGLTLFCGTNCTTNFKTIVSFALMHSMVFTVLLRFRTWIWKV